MVNMKTKVAITVQAVSCFVYVLLGTLLLQVNRDLIQASGYSVPSACHKRLGFIRCLQSKPFHFFLICLRIISHVSVGALSECNLQPC